MDEDNSLHNSERIFKKFLDGVNVTYAMGKRERKSLRSLYYFLTPPNFEIYCDFVTWRLVWHTHKPDKILTFHEDTQTFEITAENLWKWQSKLQKSGLIAKVSRQSSISHHE